MEKLVSILKQVFVSKRAKSFYWRAGLGFLIGFTVYLTGILPDLGLPEGVVYVMINILNEVTKSLNKKNGQ